MFFWEDLSGEVAMYVLPPETEQQSSSKTLGASNHILNSSRSFRLFKNPIHVKKNQSITTAVHMAQED